MQQLSVNSAVAGLLFTGLLLYLWAPVYRIIAAPETAVAEEYLQQISYTLQGIILRDEILLPAPEPGGVSVVSDGQAIPAGALIVLQGGDPILAPEAGIYIRETDGFEYLTADTLSALTPTRVDTLLQAHPDKSSDSGKIISGNGWLLAVTADEDAVSLLQEGRSVTLSVQTDTPFEVAAVVTQISPPENGRCAVVFRCIDHLQEIAHLRHLTVSLPPTGIRGLRIPAEAVQTDENGSFVYKISASLAEKTYVNILSEEDGFMIVAKDSSAHALHAGDIIMIGSPDLKEGLQ